MTERDCGMAFRVARLLSGYPLVVVIVIIALTAASVVTARRLKFDFTPQAIYRGNDELVTYSEEFKQTFGYDDAIILVVLEAIGPDDVLEPQPLQWQAEMAAAATRIAGVSRVDSLPTLQIPQRVFLRARLKPVIEELPVTEQSAARARDLLSNLHLVHVGMLSRDSRVAAIAVYLEPDRRDLESMQAAVDAVNDILVAQPLPDGYRVALTGLPTLRCGLVNEWISDLQVQIPVEVVVYLALLGYVFRRVSGSLLPVIAVGAGVLWTVAFYAATGTSLNFVSNALPALLVIIGVSGCTQIVTCYAAESRLNPDRRVAGRRMIEKMAPASLLAAMTTAIGFCSLMTAKSELLFQFGWQAATGIATLYLSTLLVLAVLIQFFRPPNPAVIDDEHPGFVTRIAALLGATACHKPIRVIVAALLIAGGSVWLGCRVVINTYSVREILPEHHPLIKTMRLVENKLIGIMPLEIDLQIENAERLSDPELFHKILEFEQWARGLPGVLSVQSYADLYQEILANWPGRRATETPLQQVPLNESGKARLARTAKFAMQFSDALHYSSYVVPEGNRARIQLRLSEIGSRTTLDVIGRLEAKLRQIFPEKGPIRFKLTGECHVNAIALTVLIRDLYYSLLTASIVIFTLIGIEFRSPRMGLIAAIANLTPLAVMLGYMGLRGYDMNVTSVIVFTVSLGLADDNSIYFLYRFRQELFSGISIPEAIRKAFLGTGRAIVLTSTILLAGLSVLLMSDFIPTRIFAELTIVTIFANFIGVLLLLPACLALLWRVPDDGARTEP
jgi:uncharacterized protein